MATTTLGRSGAREYGKREFQDAIRGFEADRATYGELIQSAVGDVRTGLSDARAIQDQFKPGGSFGAGLKQEGKEVIERGVARDTAALVASGQSSLGAARGVNVLAGREYAKQAADIEDLRATRQIQAVTPYSQMISNLSNLVSSGVQLSASRPSYAQSVRLGTPEPVSSRGNQTRSVR